MPCKIVCERCNYLFYSGNEVKNPFEILSAYPKCPRCGKKLELKHENIRIGPATSSYEDKLKVLSNSDKNYLDNRERVV
jgi:NAD-dependent SIR2 family protein deacetylase